MEIFIYIYAGHGSSRENLPVTSPDRLAVSVGQLVFKKQDFVVPARYTPYGISFMAILGCYTAAPTPLTPKAGMPFKYSPWEVNVAKKGTFIGITSEVNLHNWIENLIACHGANAE